MCGIAGVLGPAASRELARRMADAQAHRGPDDEGTEVLPTGVPDRGRVLTQLSIFWFRRTADLVPNHLLEAGHEGLPPELDGRCMVVRRARRIDFECVVRGYLAGSAWAEYRQSGTMAGEPLPAGLRQSEQLPEPIFTPATKADSGHDEKEVLMT